MGVGVSLRVWNLLLLHEAEAEEHIFLTEGLPGLSPELKQKVHRGEEGPKVCRQMSHQAAEVVQAGPPAG